MAAPVRAHPSPSVAAMSTSDKLGEVLRRSLPLLRPEARAEIEKLIEPGTLALMAATVAVWAGAHFFAVGEVVDVILLIVGVALLGAAALDGARELVAFGTTVNARTTADFDRAAHHLARAITIIGITTVMAVLLRKSAKAVKGRAPKADKPGLIELEAPPPKGKVKIVSDASLPAGYGETTAYGDIVVSSRGSATEQALVVYHELVHSFLSPKLTPLRHFRARLAMSAYQRSAIMRYLEEALAETYAQLRVHGITAMPTGIKFPVATGEMQIIYVSGAQLAAEGAAIGTIVLGTMTFNVTFRPKDPKKAAPR